MIETSKIPDVPAAEQAEMTQAAQFALAGNPVDTFMSRVFALARRYQPAKTIIPSQGQTGHGSQKNIAPARPPRPPYAN